MDATTFAAADLQSLVAIDVNWLAQMHGSRLYQFVLRRVRNPEDAEDIVQSVYVEAMRNSSSFAGRSAPQTWLFGIAMNLIRHRLTRAADKRYHFVSDDGLVDLVDENADDPYRQCERQSLARQLGRAMETLPKDMQAVVDLVLMQDRSYEDAASMLGVPIGTIRSRLFRARERLQLQLAE
jgi:RNA polymerase sigma factor (sigma-70 family)